MHHIHAIDRQAISSPRSRMTLSLFPARLLSSHERLQALINALPAGSFLLCLPNARDAQEQEAWDAIVWSVRALGRPTFVFSLAELESTLSP